MLRQLWHKLWTPVAVSLVLALVAALQIRDFVPGLGETDSAAYLILAERLAAGGPVTVIEDDPFLYNPHCWLENPRGEVVPKYAPGQSLLMAIGLKIGGEKAALAVNPLLSVVGLLGAYLLFRCWLPVVPSLCALVALGINPMYLMYTNYPLAHAADVCFVTWGMFCLWRWLAAPRLAWALAAGLVLGYVQLVRPQEFLLVLPVLGAAAFALVPGGAAAGRRPWLATLALLAAYAVFPLCHMAYNAAVYGSPFQTGYGLSGEQAAFSFPAFMANVPYAVTVLSSHGLGVYLGLGLVGLWLGGKRRDIVLRLLWLLPMFLLCCAYYWAPRVNPTGYGRFFLSLFPVFIGSAFLLLHSLPLAPVRRGLLMVGLVLFVCGIRTLDLRMSKRIGHQSMFTEQMLAADMAAQHLPAGAVILAARPAAFHLNRGKDFRVYDLSVLDGGYINNMFERNQDSAVKLQPVREKRFRTFYTEHAGELETLLMERVAVLRDDGRTVAFLIRESDLGRYTRVAARAGPLVPLAKWRPPTGAPWALYQLQARTPGQ